MEFEVVYSATASNGNHFFVIERYKEFGDVEVQQSVSLWSKEPVEVGTKIEIPEDKVEELDWKF